MPHGELLSLVAATLLDGGSAAAGAAPPPPLDANQQQNVSDAVAALPKLATARTRSSCAQRIHSPLSLTQHTRCLHTTFRYAQGLDVNVRFTDVRAFEFTGETAIFDLLRLPLVHGWLVDPSDAATAAAVGAMSYNALVERLVGGEAPPEQALALQSFLEASASQARCFEYKSALRRALACALTRCVCVCAQLTPFGLAALHARVADGTLAVFFRNNHFCTGLRLLPYQKP